MRWPVALTYLGDVLGACVIAGGILRFIYANCVTCLLIALAVVIAGPVEDLLTRWVLRRSKNANQRQRLAHLVDLSTSIGFLICLGLAVISA